MDVIASSGVTQVEHTCILFWSKSQVKNVSSSTPTDNMGMSSSPYTGCYVKSHTYVPTQECKKLTVLVNAVVILNVYEICVVKTQ